MSVRVGVWGCWEVGREIGLAVSIASSGRRETVTIQQKRGKRRRKVVQR